MFHMIELLFRLTTTLFVLLSRPTTTLIVGLLLDRPRFPYRCRSSISYGLEFSSQLASPGVLSRKSVLQVTLRKYGSAAVWRVLGPVDRVVHFV